MENIDFESIEELAKSKAFIELNVPEKALIKKHFLSEEEYTSFRKVILNTENLKEVDFPSELDALIYAELDVNNTKQIVPMGGFYKNSRKVAAVLVLMLGTFFLGWFLNRNEAEVLSEIIETRTTDTLYVEREIIISDTIIIEKIILKKEYITEVKTPLNPNDLLSTSDSLSLFSDSIPFNSRTIVNNSLDDRADLNVFYTSF